MSTPKEERQPSALQELRISRWPIWTKEGSEFP